MTHEKFGAAALCLALLGCGGPTHRRVDAEEEGVVATRHVGMDEIRPAVKDMCDKIAKKNAEGWPAHVKMSNDPVPKPVVAIDALQNRTRNPEFRLEALRNELLNAIVEQDIVYVTQAGQGYADDTKSVHDQRDYSQSGMTNEAAGQRIEHGQEDATSLVLRGEVVDDVVKGEDVRQHDYIFYLRLVDTTKNRPLITTSTKFRKLEER